MRGPSMAECRPKNVGMRAGMQLGFTEPDPCDMVLELAGPGGDFAAGRRMHRKRVGAR